MTRMHVIADGVQSTPWINITDQIVSIDGTPLTVGGKLEMKRVGDEVRFRVNRVYAKGQPTNGHVAILFPVGFRPATSVMVTTWDSTILSVLTAENHSADTGRLRASSGPQAPWARDVTTISSSYTDDAFPSPPYS